MNFALERQLVSEIVDRFSVGPDATQVAVVTYSGFARVDFLFNNFTSREEVQSAIAAVEYFDVQGKWIARWPTDTLVYLFGCCR